MLPLLLFEVVSLVTVGLAIFSVYQGQLQTTLDLQREMAARSAIDVEAYLSSLQADLADVGLGKDLMSFTPEQQSEILSRLDSRRGFYVDLAIVDEAGHQEAQVVLRPDAPALPSAWDSHDALLSTLIGETYMGPVEFQAGIPYMLVAAPIRDSQLRTVGMAVAQVDLSSMWDVIATAGSGQSGYVYVVDQAGNLIAVREMGLVMRQPDVTELVGVRAASSNEQPTSSYGGLTGAMVIGGTSQVKGIAWNVIAELPTSEAYAHLISLLPMLGLEVLIGLALAVGVWFYVSNRIVTPILEITRGAQFIGEGRLDHRVKVKTRGELAVLAHVLNSTTTQLQNLIGSLEQRVADRTLDLERRSVQMEAAAEVARDAAAIRDVNRLLGETVRLISDQFGFYHAGIFLLDDRREYAVLQAASSKGGQRMLARRHRLKVGEVGIVGYAAGTGKPRIALDVGADAVFFDNPDLPDTRSEMGLPLKVREQVIGVLDVQSTEEAAFSDEDVAILQTMADQVALAIENAHLLEESQRALRELESLYGQRTRETWRERTFSQPAYRYTSVGVEPVSPPLAPEIVLPPSHRKPVVLQEKDGRKLVAPIRLRGQTLGSVVLRQETGVESWTPDELALIDEVSTQIGLALENARLLEDTRRRAQREFTVREISDKVSASFDLETVLRTTVEELSTVLGASGAVVELGLFQEET